MDGLAASATTVLVTATSDVTRKKFSASEKGLVAMMRIMDVVGVESWEDLPGKYVRVVDNEWGSEITRIGNVIKDKWFDLKEFFAQ